MPEVDTPPDDVKLWRYLNLSSFLTLISQQSLYFPSLSEFEDRWEGVMPTSLTKFIKSQPTGAHRLHRLMKGQIGRFRVNCWHRNEVESVAMWKLYTRGIDGVAVQTTIGRLKNSLEGIFGIGSVVYQDHKSADSDVSALLLKRRSFAHESEVRVFSRPGLR
jgi:hypothetical protein